MFGVEEDFEVNTETTSNRLNAEDLIKVNEMIGDLVTQKISQYHIIYSQMEKKFVNWHLVVENFVKI